MTDLVLTSAGPASSQSRLQRSGALPVIEPVSAGSPERHSDRIVRWGHIATPLSRAPVSRARSISLGANFSWTLLGNGYYAASQFGLLIALARLGSLEVVGQFSMAVAIVAPAFMFANLQLRGLQATDASRTYRFDDYWQLRLLTSGLVLSFVSVGVGVAGLGWDTSLTIILIAVAKGLESLSDLLHGTFQRQERMDRVARSLLIKGSLAIVALSFGTWITGASWGAACGLTLAWGITLVAYDWPAAARVRQANPTDASRLSHQASSIGLPQTNWGRRGRLAAFALPLGFVMALISLNANIPRYFIAANFGERILGVFASMSHFVVVGALVVDAIGQTASPRLARHHAAGDRAAFRALLRKMILTGATLGILGVAMAVLFGSQLLTIVYGSEYSQHANVFAGLMVAGGLMYVASMLGYGATAMRRVRYQPCAIGTVTCVMLLFSALLIPRHGLPGAAVALTISAATCVACYTTLLVSKRISR